MIFPIRANLAAIQAALEAAGVAFVALFRRAFGHTSGRYVADLTARASRGLASPETPPVNGLPPIIGGAARARTSLQRRSADQADESAPGLYEYHSLKS